MAVPTMVSVRLVVPVEVSSLSRLGNAPGSSFPGVTPGEWLVACPEVVFRGVSWEGRSKDEAVLSAHSPEGVPREGLRTGG